VPPRSAHSFNQQAASHRLETRRYPQDYVGIIAGAPVNARTHQLTWELSVAQAVHCDAPSYIPPAKYPAINRAALNACDARDGVTDGVIDDPSSCRFDPQTIACTAGDDTSCLTGPQVEAVRRIYAPPAASTTPRTSSVVGREIRT
jgi:feruloyl esterase